jgi:hypothetical protein
MHPSGTPIESQVITVSLRNWGWLMNCLHSCHGQLRGEARRAHGRVQERAEAIAAAVDLLVSGGLWRKLQAHADQILARAEKDLAGGGD